MNQITPLFFNLRTGLRAGLLGVLFTAFGAGAQSVSLDFSEPATNSAPGATFTDTFSYTPTNATALFFTSILSGTNIVPSSNFTAVQTDPGDGELTLQPLTNTSGTVEARLQTVLITGGGSTTNVTDFEVVFQPYPPEFVSGIANLTMDEDDTLNRNFSINDPDTPNNSLTVEGTSGNTTLITTNELTFGGSGGSRSITFEPLPNENGTSTIELTLEDGDYSIVTNFTLTVDPVPDTSTISNVANAAFGDDVNITNIFANVVIDDVDHNRPNTENLILTVTLGSDQFALLENGSTTFTTTAPPSGVTSAIQNLGVVPEPFRGIPGTVNSESVTITVQGAADSITVTENLTMNITVINNPPTFQSEISPTAVVEGQQFQPFDLVFVSDPDQGDDTFTIELMIADTNQAGFGSFTPTNRITDNASGLLAALENIVFQATLGVVTGVSEDVDIAFTMTDGFGGVTVETNTLTILQTQTPPVISGIPASATIKSDGSPVFNPLPTVFISDPDNNSNQLVRATLSASDPSLGTLTPTNFPLQSTASLTAALRAVQYEPTPGVLPVGTTADSVISVNAIDELGLESQNNNLIIRITSVNNPPRILNIPPESAQPVLIPPVDPILPFSGIGLSSDETNDVTFTIALDDADKGSFTNLGGFAETSGGTIEMQGSASDIVMSLTNVQYVLNPLFNFPVDDPGGTTYTLTAQDFSLNTASKTLAIQVQAEPRNHLVTRTAMDNQPGSLNYALANYDNNDVITFALPSYPAVLRMPGSSSTLLDKNVTLKGPGADLLTLSGDTNGDGTPNRQIFRVRAKVAIEGLTLSHGGGDGVGFGGAVLVETHGRLSLFQCAVVHSIANQYGGGIDVNGGGLTVDSCFFGENTLSEDSGFSGGAISVLSDEDIKIVNTTFSNNSQPNETGDGGGALFLQKLDAASYIDTELRHNTFKGNRDDTGRASAVFSVTDWTRVKAWNNIFNDFSGRNLNVNGGGWIQSQGGNICDDSTRVVLTQEEGSEDVFLLNSVSDDINTDAQLSPLNTSGDPTPFYQPLSGSPAIDKGTLSDVARDQRGILRTDTPDTGAIESDSLARLVINEIQFDESPVDFIEFVARRDSTPVNLAGFSVFVDGIRVHDFSGSTVIGTNAFFTTAGAPILPVVEPGFGLVLAFATNTLSLTSSNNPTPVIGASVTNVNLESRSVVTVARSNTEYPGAHQSWVGTYLDPVSGTNELNTAGESISLAPQFRGFALVPHSFILAGPFSGVDTGVAVGSNPTSPGGDNIGTPFGQDNAEPLALADGVTLTEDETLNVDVLGNDFDGDGNDRLFVVDVSTFSDPATGDVGATNSQQGASVEIDPAALPLRGNRVFYDPRVSPTLQSLPVGAELQDVFYYEILDYGFAAIDGYSALGTNTLIASLNHRLATNDMVDLSGSSITAYNGSFSVVPQDKDSFTIPVSFVGNPSSNGTWLAQATRTPTTRDETSVTLTLIGVNDPPVANPDVITNVTEESVVRIMSRPDLAGAVLSFPTDPVPPPVPLTNSLVANDTDIDTDDDANTLRVIGVLSNVNAIANFAGTVGSSPVSVTSTSHGLTTGDEILISGYGGAPSYNGYKTVTVVDADTFTVPVAFVDNVAPKGVWAVLNDSNRFEATTDVGAEVVLTLRADTNEDHLIYDASTSTFLNGLQEDELYTNTFYYGVEDSHGAVSIGAIQMVVRGLNDVPTPSPDPSGVDVLDPLVTESNDLETVLSSGLDLEFTLAPESGASNRVDLIVSDPAQVLSGLVQMTNIWFTDEATPITILHEDLLVNDGDVDRLDVLAVDSVEALSREGAGLSNTTNSVAYNPLVSSNLNALARDELIIDTFEVVITDMMTAGQVTSLVAVVVQGINDTPIAVEDFTTTTEDDVLTLNPIMFPTTNAALHDIEFDINGNDPDDLLRMLVVSNLFTGADAEVDIEQFLATYDPTVSDFLNELADWQSHTDRFSYTISDHSFLFAEDDLFRVPTDSGERSLDVLANDTDYTVATGMPLIVDISDTLNGGVASIATGGTHILYTPAASYVGDDFFRYTVENSEGDSDTAVVRVRAETPRLNGVISTADDLFYLAAGESDELDVLANDDMLPADGSALSLIEILNSSLPGQPVLTNGTVRYTATNGQSAVTFQYRVTGGGTSTAIGNARIEIVERRGSLDVRDDVASVQANTQSTEIDVLSNDALLTASVSTLRIQQILTAPSNGVLTTNGTATSLIYTPDADFIGTEDIDYVATDMMGGTGTGTLRIVVGVLDVARDAYTFATSTNGFTATLDVLDNDRVLPNPAGTLEILSVGPTGGVSVTSSIGTLSVSTGMTSLVFAPTNVLGQQDFTYTVSDSSLPGRVETGIVTLAVSGNGTYANPDRYIVRGESENLVLDVLSNDISVPDVNKTYSVLGLTTNGGAPSASGIVNVVSNQLIYTPASGFTGEETFIYEISDSVDTDTAKVTVQVKPGDLYANKDLYTVFYDVPAGTNVAQSFTLPVLNNDRILPALGQVFSITGVGIDDTNQTNAPSQSGDVVISGDAQSLIYTPVKPAVSNYIERFTYVISDGGIRLAEGQVEVLVINRTNALNSVTADDVFTVDRNSAGNQLSVLENDGVLPGNTLDWTLTGVMDTATTGTVSISGRNAVYAPPPDFVGVDSFGYQVEDSFGGTGTGMVVVRVGELPTTADEFAVLSESSANELDVVVNDSVTTNWVEEYTLHSVFGATRGGLVSLSGNNTVLYTPTVTTGAFPYVESFRYRIDDDSGILTTGQVQVTVHELGSDRDTTNVVIVVQGQNDPPTIDLTPLNSTITDKETAQPFSSILVTEVDEQRNEVIDVTVTLDDAEKGLLRNLGLFDEGPAGTYTVTNITAATANVNLRGLVYDPTENRITVPTTQTVFFTVTVTDNKSAPVVNTNAFNPVIAVNDPPVVEGTRSDLIVHQNQRIKPFAGVTITEIDDLSLQPLNVTLTLNPIQGGVLLELGGFSQVTNGVYAITNVTASNVTSTLRDIEFLGASNGVPDGVSLLTQIDIEVDDGFEVPPVTDSDTLINVQSGLQQTFNPSSSNAVERYGHVVAISSNLLAVGAPTGDTNGVDAGYVTLYERIGPGTNQWNEVITIQPVNIQPGDQFGYDLDLEGDLLAVGSLAGGTNATPNSGAAYIFQQNAGGSNAWGQVAAFFPADASTANGDQYGFAVSLNMGNLAVGAPNHNPGGLDPAGGAIYVYDRVGPGTNLWALTDKVTQTGNQPDDRLGESVDLSGDRLAGGAPTETTDVIAGAVYIFERNQGGTNAWGQIVKIRQNDPNEGDQFGKVLHYEHPTLLVGAPGDDGVGLNAGAAYLFEPTPGTNTWTQLRKFTAPDAAPGDEFGRDVQFNAEWMLLGARLNPRPDGADTDTGTVTVYHESMGGTGTWNVVDQIVPPLADDYGQFGISIDLYDNLAAIGAPFGNAAGQSNGTFYVYQLELNNAPQVTAPSEDVWADVGTLFDYMLPTGTFVDPDPQDTLTLSVSFADETNGIPTWTTFLTGTQSISGTPVQVERVTVSLGAEDPEGRTDSDSFFIYVFDDPSFPPSSLNQWLVDQFGAETVSNPTLEPTVWGWDVDVEPDGSNNGQEYAFDGDPNASDTTAITMEPDGSGNLEITFMRRTDDPQLTYRLQSAPTPLDTWTDVSGILMEEALPVNDEFEIVTLTIPILETVPRLKYRIYVTGIE